MPGWQFLVPNCGNPSPTSELQDHRTNEDSLHRRRFMAATPDPKRVPGNRVHARSHLVLGDKAARNRFGALWKQSWICGTVEGVTTSKAGVREQTSIVVTWNVGDGEVRKSLLAINIRAGDPSVSENHPVRMIAHQQHNEIVRNVEEDDGHRHTSNRTVSNETTPHSLTDGGSNDVVHVHGYTWEREQILSPVGGPVRRRQWCLTVPGGRDILEGSDFSESRPILEYFLASFPIRHLSTIVTLTNENLISRKFTLTSPKEILKFFGVMLLMTRFTFPSRESLWQSTPRNKYIPAPNFGVTGMTRDRFRNLRSAMRFSEQGQDSEMSSSSHRWSMVSGFVDAINAHRKERMHPSDLICVDESISRWYGLGGSWIDAGLPHYVAIDRKPEYGCEIQNSACGRSGIILRLKLVVSAEDEPETDPSVLHGTSVLSYLVSPWTGTDRIVCADSYFASVQAAEHLLSMGLRFIGVVKTASRKFPIKALGSIEMSERGERHTFVHKDADGRPKILAMSWLDRERRYFVATAYSAAEGEPYRRVRWRQLADGPERITITVPQPELAEVYYSCCASIDRHNRCRQADLGIEKSFQVKEWSFRVNSSLLAMIVVDTWLLYSGSRGERRSMSQGEFYESLAVALIENRWDGASLRVRQCVDREGVVPSIPRSGISVHLVATKRKRKNKEGETLPYALFGNCSSCKRKKSRFICSACEEKDGLMCKMFLCHGSTGRACFENHVREFHQALA
jgi:hypothetical protein